MVILLNTFSLIFFLIGFVAILALLRNEYTYKKRGEAIDWFYDNIQKLILTDYSLYQEVRDIDFDKITYEYNEYFNKIFYFGSAVKPEYRNIFDKYDI